MVILTKKFPKTFKVFYLNCLKCNSSKKISGNLYVNSLSALKTIIKNPVFLKLLRKTVIAKSLYVLKYAHKITWSSYN